jgi:hypothetical protein
MIIKELVKNNRLLFNLYKVLSRGYFSLLTQISPELNTKARYKQAFKKS